MTLESCNQKRYFSVSLIVAANMTAAAIPRKAPIKMNRHLPLLLAACVAATASSAFAAPLKRSDLSAHSAWLLHVDCDALRQTSIGKYVLDEMDKPGAKNKLAAFQAIFNFDLRTQLHGVTLYSTGPKPKDGVLIIYADFDPDRLITLAKEAEAFEATTNNQHVIYGWTNPRKKRDDDAGPRVYAAIQGSRVILGKREEGVTDALAVMDGATPNLSTSNNLPDWGASGQPAFLQAAARKLDFLGSNPNAVLLKLSRQLKFQAGETDQHVNAALTLEADDENTARQMATVAQGLLALLTLQQDNPNAAKLANAISVKQNGASLTAILSVPSADLIGAWKAEAAKKARKKAEAE